VLLPMAASFHSHTFLLEQITAESRTRDRTCIYLNSIKLIQGTQG